MIPYIVTLGALAYYGHWEIVTAVIVWELIVLVIYLLAKDH